MPEIHIAEPRFLRIDAASVCDADAAYSPGSLLLELRQSGPPVQGALHAKATVIAAGRPDVVSARAEARSARLLHLPRTVVIPGLVNAHTHLDLTHIGPRSFDHALGFSGFVNTVRGERKTLAPEIAESVARGVEYSLRAGVVCVGDIGGATFAKVNPAAYQALAASPMWGVSYLEYFAIGRTQAAALERVEAVLADLGDTAGRVRPGLQPHATNTVSPGAYRWTFEQARRRGLPIATHLAETPEEREFVGRATGPQRHLLEKVGAWEDSLLGEFGLGRSPVAHFARAVGGPPRVPMLVAHVNDLGEDLEVLKSLETSVVYCPTASEYFGADRYFGPHRYRDLIAAGVNVGLGTDSIINLPEDRPALSVWEEMRRLRTRDALDAKTLLRMATVNGARALGLGEGLFRFTPGCELAGVTAVRMSAPGESGRELEIALETSGEPELILLGK